MRLGNRRHHGTGFLSQALPGGAFRFHSGFPQGVSSAHQFCLEPGQGAAGLWRFERPYGSRGGALLEEQVERVRGHRAERGEGRPCQRERVAGFRRRSHPVSVAEVASTGWRPLYLRDFIGHPGSGIGLYQRGFLPVHAVGQKQNRRPHRFRSSRRRDSKKILGQRKALPRRDFPGPRACPVDSSRHQHELGSFGIWLRRLDARRSGGSDQRGGYRPTDSGHRRGRVGGRDAGRPARAWRSRDPLANSPVTTAAVRGPRRSR